MIGFCQPIKVKPGPGLEAWKLDPSFWTSAGFMTKGSSSEAIALSTCAGAEGVEEAVEEGKGTFVLVLLGAAFRVTGEDFACEEEEVEVDGIDDLFKASNGKEEVEVEMVKSGLDALREGER